MRDEVKLILKETNLRECEINVNNFVEEKFLQWFEWMI